MREKNQAMINTGTKMKKKFMKMPHYLWLLIIIVTFLWGCAVAPQKLNLKGKPDAFGEGTIIATRDGTAVSFEDMLKDLETRRVIFVGETHTSREDHKIQLAVIQGINEKNPDLVIGMEMFDHSYQGVLDQWSAGKLDQKAFLQKVHWYANWRFDFSLYQEIMDFIKTNHLRLVGLNVPNYIPPRIREGGIESLRDDEKKHLPQQIDLTISAHREYVQKIFENHKHHFRGDVEFENFYAAQCVWEDAMAEAVGDNLNNSVMVVLAGNGHIQYKYGIPDRTYKRTGAAFATIYPVSISTGKELDPGIADYIWVTK